MAAADPAGWRVVVTGGSGFIGTHLVDRLLARGATVTSVDVAPPRDPAHLPHWSVADVTDAATLDRVLAHLQPTHVVHLAAETDATPDAPATDYPTNLQGTRTLLAALPPSVDRLVVTSTQFVCAPGYVPADDTDYAPHTTYGATKVAVEQQVREADLDVPWTIVRPTTIWGPHDDQYRATFHALMARGWYVHPDVAPCWRSYGYVGNVCWQVERILGLPAAQIDERVLYVGDRPFDVRDFVEEFSRQWHGRRVRTIPAWAGGALAAVGTTLTRAGLPFPIQRERWTSMTTDYPVPIEPTFELLGEPPHDLADGVARTVAFLRARRAGQDPASSASTSASG